jgi:hypothetical protein
VADDPETECESETEITSKAETIALLYYYAEYYFDSNSFTDLGPKFTIKYMYKPILSTIG